MTEAQRWPSVGRPSLFGKLVHKRDFIRVRHNAPEALAFDEWLQASLAELTRFRVPFGEARLQFMFAGARSVLAGVLLPSRDRAGRHFPVSVYTALPSSLVGDDAGAAFRGCEAFMAAAAQVLDDAPAMPWEEVERRLDALPAPAPVLGVVLAGLAPSEGQARAALRGALGTLAADRLDPTFSCAAEHRADVEPWCTALQAVYPRRVVPSLFWRAPQGDHAGRLLLATAPPHPWLLAGFDGAPPSAPKSWVRVD